MSTLDVTIMQGPHRLDAGQILLDPNDGRPRIWTVTRTTTIGADLAQPSSAGARLVARLKGTVVPEGWRVLDEDALLDALDALDIAQRQRADEARRLVPETTPPAITPAEAQA